MRGLCIFLAAAVSCNKGDSPADDDDDPTSGPVDENVAPVAADDSADVDEGDTVTVDLTGNDEDPDGIDEDTIIVVDPPVHGTVEIRGDGRVDYVHDGSESESDAFTYTVADTLGLVSNVANVAIDVDSVDDPLTTVDDAADVDEGGTVDINVLANDADDDDGLDASSVVASPPSHGTATPNGDGTITYTHDGGETDEDSFTYGVRNNDGDQSPPVEVTITVNPVNDLPVARDDAARTEGGGTVHIDPVANDVDADDGIDASSFALVDLPVNGVVDVYPDGTVDYTHFGNGSHSDTFTYTVLDLSGDSSNVATVSLDIDEPFVALPDEGIVDEGGTVNIDVAANDSDADDGIDLGSVRIAVPPPHGQATPNADGTITYVHSGDEVVGDAFSYRIRNGDGVDSPQVDVTITVNPINDVPIAVDDHAATIDGGTQTVDVLANDIDPDDGIVVTSVVIVDPPAHGVTVVNGDGTVDYVHDGLGILDDSFTYTVTDVSGQLSNVGTVLLSDSDCNTHPQWMPVTCTTTSWVWSRDRALAMDVDTAAALQILATGCIHGYPQPDLGDGLCSLDGLGWVSVDQFVMTDCDQNWYHLGGYFSGYCGGHNGDLYRHLVIDPAGCYDY